MLSFLTPHLQLDNIFELEPDALRARHLEALLLDVDGTLKDYYATEFRPEIIQWVAKLRAGLIRPCLLSNGLAGRIGRLAEALGVDYVAPAYKPLPLGCRAALRKLSLPPAKVAVMGDQVFADVLAGRLAGLFTILVRPTTPIEPWVTRIKRPLERSWLRHLNRT
jgi:hypothetical protein